MDPRLKQLDFRTLALSIPDFLMPRVCLCCGRALLPCEQQLCCVCMADLPLTHFERMIHNPMADKYNALIKAPKYEKASALFYYSGDYEKITQALKYGRNFAAGRWFARMLGDVLADAGWKADLVCPVPLHWTRHFTRGYNQAGIIGKEVAVSLGAPFEARLLRRSRRTDTQTRLNDGQRARNVAGAFEVRKGIKRLRAAPEAGPATSVLADLPLRPSNAGPWPPVSAKVLLIDDVFTTGATLASCTAALRDALGPDISINIATLAYVE